MPQSYAIHLRKHLRADKDQLPRFIHTDVTDHPSTESNNSQVRTYIQWAQLIQPVFSLPTPDFYLEALQLRAAAHNKRKNSNSIPHNKTAGIFPQLGSITVRVNT